MRQQSRENVPDVDPAVFVHFALQEVEAVGALLPHNVRAVHEALVVDAQRSALSGDDVLGVVEAEAGHVPDGA